MTSEGSHIFASPCESPPVGKHRSMVLVGSLVTKQTFSCSSSLSTSLPVQLIFDESAYDTGSQNMPWSPLLSYTDISDKRNSITLLFLFFFSYFLCSSFVARTCIYQNLWNKTKVRSFKNCQCLKVLRRWRLPKLAFLTIWKVHF